MKRRNDAIENTLDTAIMVGAWEGFPVRLVVIPEMAIQGMIANTFRRDTALGILAISTVRFEWGKTHGPAC
jgi:hypothetical protein